MKYLHKHNDYGVGINIGKDKVPNDLLDIKLNGSFTKLKRLDLKDRVYPIGGLVVMGLSVDDMANAETAQPVIIGNLGFTKVAERKDLLSCNSQLILQDPHFTFSLLNPGNKKKSPTEFFIRGKFIENITLVLSDSIYEDHKFKSLIFMRNLVFTGNKVRFSTFETENGSYIGSVTIISRDWDVYIRD